MPDDSPRDPMQWSLAKRRRSGEVTSGDLAVVTHTPDGALVAAIDGLGHGREAARAAATAAAVIREHAAEDLAALVHRCHLAMQDTRGAAITLALLAPSPGTITWLGVGNVEGRILRGDPVVRRPKASLVLGRGVPGHDLPTLRTATLGVSPGDVLILATDGIEATFADSLDISGSTQAISDRVMADHRKRPDDALVVVVRFLGGRS